MIYINFWRYLNWNVSVYTFQQITWFNQLQNMFIWTSFYIAKTCDLYNVSVNKQNKHIAKIRTMSLLLTHCPSTGDTVSFLYFITYFERVKNDSFRKYWLLFKMIQVENKWWVFMRINIHHLGSRMPNINLVCLFLRMLQALKLTRSKRKCCRYIDRNDCIF
jgi:hypothetical protein